MQTSKQFKFIFISVPLSVLLIILLVAGTAWIKGFDQKNQNSKPTSIAQSINHQPTPLVFEYSRNLPAEGLKNNVFPLFSTPRFLQNAWELMES